MGDRISIQFVKGTEKSVVLFSHWDGKSLLNNVKKYVAQLKKYTKRYGTTFPLYRLQPNTVMIDFIRHLTKTIAVVEYNYHLGATSNDGDNSDNGHYIIKL